MDDSDYDENAETSSRGSYIAFLWGAGIEGFAALLGLLFLAALGYGYLTAILCALIGWIGYVLLWWGLDKPDPTSRSLLGFFRGVMVAGSGVPIGLSLVAYLTTWKWTGLVAAVALIIVGFVTAAWAIGTEDEPLEPPYDDVGQV